MYEKMMEDCDVSISIPPAEGKSDIIRITGPQANVERAKEALLDRVQQLEDEKEQRVCYFQELFFILCNFDFITRYPVIWTDIQ